MKHISVDDEKKSTEQTHACIQDRGFSIQIENNGTTFLVKNLTGVKSIFTYFIT